MSIASTNSPVPSATAEAGNSNPRCVFRHEPCAADLAAVREIVASTHFFSASEVEVAVELIQDRLTRGDRSDYNCIFADPADQNGPPLGYSCFGPIPCTAASFDLYWIAVHNDHRGAGIGRRLIEESERAIAQLGGTRIYIETSSRPQYLPTLAFYEKCGYRVEAVLRDFYAPGDGKIILVKSV